MNSIPDVAADVHDDPEGEGPRMFLTAREVGHELGVGASRVYALAASGLLPAFRLGRRLSLSPPGPGGARRRCGRDGSPRRRRPLASAGRWSSLPVTAPAPAFQPAVAR